MTSFKKYNSKVKRLFSTVFNILKSEKHSFVNRLSLSAVPGLRELQVKIDNGIKISSEDIYPFIGIEDLQKKIFVNVILAEAFFKSGNFEYAKVFIARTWIFSKCNEQYLPLFIKINLACDDILSIREAHKSLGFKAASENKIIDALNHFNEWQNAYAIHNCEDKYCYDFEVLNQIKLLAKPHSFQRHQLQSIKGRKIRLAYLTHGMTHLNSVLVRIALYFAQYHDKTLFDVIFFVPDPEAVINENEEAIINIKKIRALGFSAVVTPNSSSEEMSLIELGRLIYDYKPDILITNAGLADLKHYFITSLKPAPLILGLCQGPPAQFVAPDFDWSITWARHPLIDCPASCSLIPLGVDMTGRKLSKVKAKAIEGIPADSLVIISSGRASKFLNIDFWKTVINVIRSHPKVYFVAVGPGEKLPSFLKELITKDVVERIKIYGWTKDYLSLLSMADVAIDTYPSGGGLTIIDSMSLGIPVISFKQNHFMEKFSQTNWSLSEEYISVPELIINRGDFKQLSHLLEKILADQDYRNNLSELCKESIKATHGSPKKMVKSCEDIYLRILEKDQSGQ